MRGLVRFVRSGVSVQFWAVRRGYWSTGGFGQAVLFDRSGAPKELEDELDVEERESWEKWDAPKQREAPVSATISAVHIVVVIILIIAFVESVEMCSPRRRSR